MPCKLLNVVQEDELLLRPLDGGLYQAIKNSAFIMLEIGCNVDQRLRQNNKLVQSSVEVNWRKT